MGHERLSSELIRALRGSRSQPAASRRLGFTSNVLYAWESGRRFPKASAFLALAKRSGVDVAGGIRGFVGDSDWQAQDPTRPVAVAQLLRLLAVDRNMSEVALATGMDRTTIARWLKGHTEPRLPELLAFVEATTQRLLEFVGIFANPGQLESTRRAFEDLMAQRHLAYDLPWSHAVLRALELESYRALPEHVPGFIAGHIGISLEEEERYLKALAAARQIRRRRGLWVVNRVLTVDTRTDEAKNRRLKEHWAATALERLRAGNPPPHALFSYNLFAISTEDLERIHRLHVEYYEKVRKVVAECESADHVVLLNLQLLPLAARRGE